MWAKIPIFPVTKNINVFVPCRFIKTCSRYLSTQIQEVQEEPTVDLGEIPKERKPRILKKFTDPFPKSIFVGKCDPTVLEYPEVLSTDEINSISEYASTLRRIIEGVDSVSVDRTGVIPPNVLKQLGDLKVCGLKIPWKEGGHGFTETETAVVGEATATDASLSKFLTESHSVCASLLSAYGNEEQKESYLRPLINGDIVFACAHLESFSLAESGSHMKTTASLEDGEIILNGHKELVCQAAAAKAFIVIANYPIKKEDGSYVASFSAFIVDKSLPGVTVNAPLNINAAAGVPLHKVTFDNVRLPQTSVLGKPGDAVQMMLKQIGGKFYIAPRVVGISKKLITDVVQYCINNNRMGRNMIELEYVKTFVGRMVTRIYALESALYLHAGLADTYESDDTFMLQCMLKVLSSQTLNTVIMDAVHLLGVEAYQPEFQYLNRLVREAHHYSICDETNLILKLTVALNGLQFAGVNIFDHVKKSRNPFMNPWYIMKKALASRKTTLNSHPTLELGLEGYLHPSLGTTAKVLEYCIQLLQKATEKLLITHASAVFEKHIELELLAEMSIIILSLASTLGRASRAYCIGLSEADMDMDIALAQTVYCQKEVNRLFEALEEGSIVYNTNKYIKIGDRIISNKGYCAESPIARNF